MRSTCCVAPAMPGRGAPPEPSLPSLPPEAPAADVLCCSRKRFEEWDELALREAETDDIPVAERLPMPSSKTMLRRASAADRKPFEPPDRGNTRTAAPLSMPTQVLLEQLRCHQTLVADRLYSLIDERLAVQERAWASACLSSARRGPALASISPSASTEDPGASGEIAVLEDDTKAKLLRQNSSGSVASSRSGILREESGDGVGEEDDDSETARRRLVDSLVSMKSEDVSAKLKRMGALTFEDEEKLRREVTQMKRERSNKRARTSNALGDIVLEQEKRPPLTLKSAIQMVVNTSAFDCVFAFVIISNAILIGAMVQFKAEGTLELNMYWLGVVELIYCILFVVELVLRMIARGLVAYCTDYVDWTWNWLDIVVVFCGIIEQVMLRVAGDGSADGEALTGVPVLRLIRVLKIVRLLRVIKVMRFFRALRMLMLGIFSTVKSCVWAIMLLCMIIYAVSILFTQSVLDYQQDNDIAMDEYPELFDMFGDILKTSFTLYLSIFGGVDWEEVVRPLFHVSWTLVLLFLMYIAFVSLAVMNVVTGLFCQTAMDAAHSDQKHIIAAHQAQRHKMEEALSGLFHEWDSSGDGLLTLDEFERHLGDAGMVSFLSRLEIDADEAWTLFKLLDADCSGGVDCSEFISGCFRLKGGARSLDIAEIRYECGWIMDKLVLLTKITSDIAEHTKPVPTPKPP